MKNKLEEILASSACEAAIMQFTISYYHQHLPWLGNGYLESQVNRVQLKKEFPTSNFDTVVAFMCKYNTYNIFDITLKKESKNRNKKNKLNKKKCIFF